MKCLQKSTWVLLTLLDGSDILSESLVNNFDVFPHDIRKNNGHDMGHSIGILHYTDTSYSYCGRRDFGQRHMLRVKHYILDK